jgi:hypothetical protein
VCWVQGDLSVLGVRVVRLLGVRRLSVLGVRRLSVLGVRRLKCAGCKGCETAGCKETKCVACKGSKCAGYKRTIAPRNSWWVEEARLFMTRATRCAHATVQIGVSACRHDFTEALIRRETGRARRQARFTEHSLCCRRPDPFKHYTHLQPDGLTSVSEREWHTSSLVHSPPSVQEWVIS